jgi:hypothetical protein
MKKFLLVLLSGLIVSAMSFTNTQDISAASELEFSKYKSTFYSSSYETYGNKYFGHYKKSSTEIVDIYLVPNPDIEGKFVKNVTTPKIYPHNVQYFNLTYAIEFSHTQSLTVEVGYDFSPPKRKVYDRGIDYGYTLPGFSLSIELPLIDKGYVNGFMVEAPVYGDRGEIYHLAAFQYEVQARVIKTTSKEVCVRRILGVCVSKTTQYTTGEELEFVPSYVFIPVNTMDNYWTPEYFDEYMEKMYPGSW